MDKKVKARGLGRGLSALMADVAPGNDDDLNKTATKTPDQVVPIEKIIPNPNQPRRNFTKEQLEDLANSIRSKGVIQPLIVRSRIDTDGEYEIVAGERRWRAAQMAQLHELPVLVRDLSDTEVLEIAIIENIQRADLNPVEEASGYKQLMDRFGHTQEKLAEALGKSRSHIANLLRLLSLPTELQSMIEQGDLTAGHARALITSQDSLALARQVVEKGLSVRETEKLAKNSAAPVDKSVDTKSGSRKKDIEKDADTLALEGDLSAALRMKVSVSPDVTGESGIVSIRYGSFEQLDDLCQVLSRTD